MRRSSRNYNGWVQSLSGFLWGISFFFPLLSLSGKEYQGENTLLLHHQRQLRQLQHRIEELRLQLQKSKQEEQSAQQRLQRMRHYRNLLERSIALMSRELQRLEDSLDRVQRELALLGARRDTLGDYQRRLIRSFYLYWHTTEDSAARLRLQYYTQALLHHCTSQQQELSRRHDTVVQLRLRLQQLQHQRHQWLQRREVQRQELESVLRQQERTLAALRTRQRELRRLLQERQHSAQRLQRTIERLIAAAQQQKKPQTPVSSPSQRGLTPPSPAIPQTATTRPPLHASRTLSERLLWPSSSRRLLRGYGLQRSHETGIVWENPGVDIAAPQGSPVRAVAAGVVKLIQWLPTYQNVVVVEHPNDLRSVYANLASLSVSVGASVSQGATLGSAGSTPYGEGFHFQIWHSRQRLNPLEAIP
ncbi:MAG: peptidoglycan DD-metalloendopeptidase family protein [Bacteroidota bacterium]|nr:peptidoglycan DD-metalloendopeptidase family protein [Bacteroidota bacterium]